MKRTWTQLSPSDIRNIRNSDEPVRVLAVKYERTPRTIRDIQSRRIWNNIIGI